MACHRASVKAFLANSVHTENSDLMEDEGSDRWWPPGASPQTSTRFSLEPLPRPPNKLGSRGPAVKSKLRDLLALWLSDRWPPWGPVSSLVNHNNTSWEDEMTRFTSIAGRGRRVGRARCGRQEGPQHAALCVDCTSVPWSKTMFSPPIQQKRLSPYTLCPFCYKP